MKNKAQTHYMNQLETLHNLLWKMDCYHVNQLNKANNEQVNYSDVGTMTKIIEDLKEIVRFAEGKEE